MFKFFLYIIIYISNSLLVAALTVTAKLRVASHRASLLYLFRKEKKNIAVRLGIAEDVPQTGVRGVSHPSCVYI